MNPFSTLGVPFDCSDEEVRAAYRARLKRYTPEHHPARFQMIQQAYERIRTENDRWNVFLDMPSSENLPAQEVLEQFCQLPQQMKPPGTAAFQELLKGCAESTSAKFSR